MKKIFKIFFIFFFLIFTFFSVKAEEIGNENLVKTEENGNEKMKEAENFNEEIKDSNQLGEEKTTNEEGETKIANEEFKKRQEEKEKKDFAIEYIEVIAFNKIKIVFNSNLDDSLEAKREFIVFNRKDNLDDLNVINTQLDENNKKNLFVTFDKEGKPNGEYELNVLDITDEEGRNIEFGIKGIEFFVMPEKFDEIDKNIELNSAKKEEKIKEDTKQEKNSGQNLGENQIVKNTISEGKKVKKLPNTGPEYFLILLLSLVLGILIFVFKYKKV